MNFGWDEANQRAFVNAPVQSPITFTHGGVNERMRITTNGNVGINNLAPTAKLHILDNSGQILFGNGGCAAGSAALGFASALTCQNYSVLGDGTNTIINRPTGGAIAFREDNLDQMLVLPGGAIEIAGKVGIGTSLAIGTTRPESVLHIFKESKAADTVGGNLILNRFFDGVSWRGASLFSYFPTAHGHDVLAFGVSESSTAPNTIAAVKMVVSATGNVGIGTDAPDNKLTVNGSADKPGGGSWGTFSDERLKNIKGRFAQGLKAVMQLQPVRYEYKPDNALGIKSGGEHVGFSAQAVEKIIPEAVTKNDKGYRLINNDPILWTMLNAIKEQQSQIESQKTLIQSQQKRLETQQQQIEQQRRQGDALKRLVCSMNASAEICKEKEKE
jgi:hypothetical protein